MQSQSDVQYFKFLKKVSEEIRVKILLPPMAFAILFIFNFEDILWFRLFYGPRMSYRIDNLFEPMWWLDFHIAGQISWLMGFQGAVTLSLLITSAIGYTLFTTPVNIKKEGIRLLEEKGITVISGPTVGTTGSHACGDRVRPS